MMETFRTARGQLKAVWLAIFAVSAANVSIGIHGPITWSLAVGAIGLVLSVLALRSFNRDERRGKIVQVFE